MASTTTHLRSILRAPRTAPRAPPHGLHRCGARLSLKQRPAARRAAEGLVLRSGEGQTRDAPPPEWHPDPGFADMCEGPYPAPATRHRSFGGRNARAKGVASATAMCSRDPGSTPVHPRGYTAMESAKLPTAAATAGAQLGVRLGWLPTVTLAVALLTPDGIDMAVAGRVTP
uniref:Uncharacterized protein n=1 Tax=Arundo donax TaxID=35708 RepID=A0A0A8Z3F3_ARUDO